jgi:outer membrane immunogenic protein
MNRLLIAALGLAVLTTSAVAADMPVKARAPAYVPPAWSWSGFYVGVNIGGGWGVSTGDLVGFSQTPGILGAIADGRIPGSLDVTPDGVIGGAQIGVNWQTGVVVFGLEADIQGSGIEEERNFRIAGPGLPALPALITAEERIRWFGTARARFGVTPIERALFYVTGGFAYGRVHSSARIAFEFPGGGFDGDFSGSQSDGKTGWTAGGGFEYCLGQQLVGEGRVPLYRSGQHHVPAGRSEFRERLRRLPVPPSRPHRPHRHQLQIWAARSGRRQILIDYFPRSF